MCRVCPVRIFGKWGTTLESSSWASKLTQQQKGGANAENCVHWSCAKIPSCKKAPGTRQHQILLASIFTGPVDSIKTGGQIALLCSSDYVKLQGIKTIGTTSNQCWCFTKLFDNIPNSLFLVHACTHRNLFFLVTSNRLEKRYIFGLT